MANKNRENCQRAEAVQLGDAFGLGGQICVL